MNRVKEQKCPRCGAPLRFDPASGLLICDYCGTKTRVGASDTAEERKAGKRSGETGGADGRGRTSEGTGGTDGRGKSSEKSGGADGRGKSAEKSGGADGRGKSAEKSGGADGRDKSAEKSGGADGRSRTSGKEGVQKPETPGEDVQENVIEGFDFSALSDMVSIPGAEDLPVYNCVSCGSEVIAPAEQAALTCPYCGNNIVLTQKVSGNLRPNGVIPFKIQAEDLPKSVNQYYKDKKLLPPGFFSKSTMGRVTGVYLPFWVFNGNVSGKMYFHAKNTASVREGDYIITTTGHYQLVREASIDFENIPVDASIKADDRLMDSLEPFHMSEVKPFDMGYLAGFTADRFDQNIKDMASRVRNRMQSSASSIITSRACYGYGSVTLDGNRLGASIDAKYILFPVYLFDISHAGKSYHFAVNGQTGKVVGELPTDRTTSILYFLKRFLLVSGGLIAISIVRYFMGY